MKHFPPFVVLLFLACAPAGKQDHVLAPTEFQQRLQATPAAILLDVRTPQEIAGGQIAGARNLVFGAPGFDQEVLKIGKLPVFVYCAGGGRSGKVARLLQKHGYEVYDLQGGFANWKTQGLPVAAP